MTKDTAPPARIPSDNQAAQAVDHRLTRPVLVLDSGVGGLTVVRAIRAALPALRLSYLADNAGFPYGAQSVAVLAERVGALVASAQARLDVAAVVVACNTASTTVLDALRRRFTLPIVGVVPAIKPAGALSRTRHIALLATAATVQREYIDTLAARFAPDCRITRVGSPVLADMAEARVRGEPVDHDALRAILAPLHATGSVPIDTVILGCTHYPLLLDALQAVSPAGLRWLDPAPAVARRLADVLTNVREDRPDGALVRRPALTDNGLARTAPDTAWFTRDLAAEFAGNTAGLTALTACFAEHGFACVDYWPTSETLPA